MINSIFDIIGMLMLFIIILIFAMFVHEYFHKHFLSKYKGSDVPIKFYYKSWREFGFEVGQVHDYVWLNRKQLLNVYMFGILSGFAVILMAVGFFPWLPVWLMFFPYLAGCRSDIKQCINIIRKRHLEWEY